MFFLFLCLSLTVFWIGFLSTIFFNKHLINILISLELMILVCNINFVFFSIIFNDILGQIFCLISLTIAAAESSIALAIVILYYNLHGGIFIDFIMFLKS